MQYNAALGDCPNCGTKPHPWWRQVFAWHWPLPLAIGLALQILSQRTGPDRPRLGVPELPELASVSQFITGVLVFSVLAALLLFAVERTRTALRRWSSRRRRREARRRLR
jgi:uncharacterized protein HemY